MKNLYFVRLLLAGLLLGHGLGVTAQQAVSSYTLVNAVTNLDIQALLNGANLDLATLPTRNLNIRANTNPGTVGSVVFSLSGTQTVAHTENVVPYALFSDLAGDYEAWRPASGTYTLLATPYSGALGGGTAGTALAIVFTITNSQADAIVSYTLVNADTDTDIQALPNGANLDLATLPTRNLNIRANTNPGTVGSVVFSLSGTQTVAHTENVAPYALFSDSGGDYAAWTPANGTYHLTATPYGDFDAAGDVGNALVISFTVGKVPLPVELISFTVEAQPAGAVLLQWSTATELHNRDFVVQRSPDGQRFLDLATVPGHGTSSVPQHYHYLDAAPANAGTSAVRYYYRLRQEDLDQQVTYSLVRVIQIAPVAGPPMLVLYPTILGAAESFHYQLTGASMVGAQADIITLQGQRAGPTPATVGVMGQPNAAGTTGLAPGIYLLRLTTSSGRYYKRFIVR